MSTNSKKIQGPIVTKVLLDIELTLSNGQTKNLEFEQEKIIVGRGKNCDIKIDDSEVSRQHLLIEMIEGKIFITDLGSSNGTFINNDKLKVQEKIEFNTLFIPIYLGGKISLALSLKIS